MTDSPSPDADSRSPAETDAAAGSGSDDATIQLPAQRPLVDGYVGFEEIGRGGFGVVYRATQVEFNRTVALKILTGVFDEAARARFERECRALGALSDHPNIVTVHAAGMASDGRPYLAMEFLSGGSVAQRIGGAPLEWAQAAVIGIKIAAALQRANDSGILHRDVKPDNILISSYDEPKLADFGIAHIRDGFATGDSTVTATLVHAAPELIDGGAASAASDVYALASTVFTLIAGSPAFARRPDESIAGLIARVVADAPPDLRQRDVPAGVCEVLERGLAKSPGDRQASAQMFGQELQQAARSAGSDPAQLSLALPWNAVAHPQGATTAASPSGRGSRRRAVVAAAAVLVIALVAMLAVLALHNSASGAHPVSTPSATAGISHGALQQALLLPSDVPKDFTAINSTEFAMKTLAICSDTFPFSDRGYLDEADNSFQRSATTSLLSSGVAEFAPGTGKPAFDSIIAATTGLCTFPNTLFSLDATTTITTRSGPSIAGADQVLRLHTVTTQTTLTSPQTVMHDQVFLRRGDIIAVVQYDSLGTSDAAVTDSLAAALALRVKTFAP